MARDYKHRVNKPSYSSNNRRQPKRKSSGSFWRLLLVAVLLVVFVLGLNMISNMVKELMAGKPELFTKPSENKVKQELVVKQPVAVESEKKVDTVTATEPEEPRYDFYTILPQAEVVVPDYEIKTRVREELVGKTKTAKYMMQAGSFRDTSEAERHKAKLAQLGIESRIEAAKVGNVMWYRVKVGPYDNSSSVATIKDLLVKNGIGVIVTEGGNQ
ncbi:MAG: SPOR domain-containing protein [Methylomonas sp.]